MVLRSLFLAISAILNLHVVGSAPFSVCSQYEGERHKRCIEFTTSYTSYMERHYLTDDKSICNDGSQAGYYVRTNRNSKVWIVYLAGGSFCHDEKSCISRMNQPSTRTMMTSKDLSDRWEGFGLLKDDSYSNKHFSEANHVYVPYCSSDFWLGNVTRDTSTGKKLHFYGSHIVSSLIKKLLSQGLKDATTLILAGSSAGGIGVTHNINRILQIIQINKLTIDVRGLIDSAWFIDSGVSASCDSNKNSDCHPKLFFKEATRYWNAEIDKTCAERLSNQKHECLFAETVLQDLRSPIFVFQWIYDTAQIYFDNKGIQQNGKSVLTDPKYMSYVKQLGENVKKSLKNIKGKHGVFAGSCISHTALTSTDIFEDFVINGSNLNDALSCWLSQSKNEGKQSNPPCKQRIIESCPTMICGKCPATSEQIPTAGVSEPKVLRKKDIELINQFLKTKEFEN